ncbi:MAG: Gfo/Idh/MocA family protein [Granulosicoccus sp.]
MKTRIAVVGVGLIGQRHARAILNCAQASLAAIVDPSETGSQIAHHHGVPYYASLGELLATGDAQGVILATPNQMHVEHALACIRAGIPVLVEKPLAVDAQGALQVVRASSDKEVPVLTGHHRRHNPLVARARQVIDSGDLGDITAIQATTWFYKPDDYFDVEWRRRTGAGPVYINLIHDVDMLRHLCGEVQHVFAMESSLTRGYEVEDTAVITLQFDNGALGTLTVSDTIVSPWSWELTARENPVYPVTSESCYQIGGTKASLSLPNLALWHHPNKKSWWEPISSTRLKQEFDDPLICQIMQFVAVINGEQAPLVSAWDGYQNQLVIEAVKQSAATGLAVRMSSG